MASPLVKWALPMLLLGLLLLPQVTGIVPKVGVRPGDWAHYVVSQHTTGNQTLVKNYVAQYSAYVNTSYVDLNITTVTGTNVSLTQGIHHTNGVTNSSYSTIDVSQAVDPSNPPIIIMQNYPYPTMVSSGSFFGVPRTINTIIVNSPGDNSSASRYSWDNSTGVLLSEQLSYIVDSSSKNNATFAFTFSISSTSLWHYVPQKNQPGTPPPAPFGLQFAELYVLVGIIGAAAVGVVAFVAKRPPKARGKSGTGRAYRR